VSAKSINHRVHGGARRTPGLIRASPKFSEESFARRRSGVISRVSAVTATGMRLSGGPNWTLGVARRGLARVLMSFEAYDHVHQRPLRIDVTLYRLARQFAQRENGSGCRRSSVLPAVFTLAFICFPATSTSRF